MAMHKPTTQETLILNLKMLMTHNNMSVSDLAKKSGITARMIYMVLNKERKPGIELADSLAKAFGLSGWHIIKPNLPYDMIRSGKMEEVEKNFLACEQETQEYVLSVMRRELSK